MKETYSINMHVIYEPENVDVWVEHYINTIQDQNHHQLGYGMPGDHGYIQYQRGKGIGNFLKGVFRIAQPLLKSIGKQALVSGAHFAADVTQGRDAKEAFMDHGKQAVGSLLHKAADKIQSGEGIGHRLHGVKRKRSLRSFFIPKKPKRPWREIVSPDVFDIID